MTRTAFFPGSFDPATNGHLDVLSGALEIADKVVVGIGIHPTKAPLFDPEERAAILNEIVADMGGDAATRVSVMPYADLLVNAARRAGATVLVRGIRDATDLDFEFRMAAMNRDLAPELKTVFIPAAPTHRHISATLVRQLAQMGTDVSAFAPAPVVRRLAELR